MTCENSSEKKCFTFLWKLENINYCWQKMYEYIESPSFVLDEIGETKWYLRLFPVSSFDKNCIHFYLWRHANSIGAGIVKIDYELAFLALDGTVLESERKLKETFHKGTYSQLLFKKRTDRFVGKRSAFLPQDTRMVRCKIWKCEGEITENAYFVARTRISVEMTSFTWNITNFSALELDEKYTREVKSLTGETVISLELGITGGQIFPETIRFAIAPNYDKVKLATFKLLLIDTSGNTVKCFEDEFWVHAAYKTKEFNFFLTKNELIAKKSTYLPNDVLTLRYECVFTSGILLTENCQSSDCLVLGTNWSDSKYSGDKNVETPNFMSMFTEGILSDVKLKTSSNTHPAHKCVLSSRSPVFKAMFSNNMREKINDSVEIEDFGEDTILRMLQFIYGAEVKDLEWGRAKDLYEAADKYQILGLMDLCSSYLKDHLCATNVCEALLLADLHQDQDLKRFVQEFILRKSKDIINSEQWEHLMENNLKLAAETMRLKFKE